MSANSGDQRGVEFDGFSPDIPAMKPKTVTVGPSVSASELQRLVDDAEPGTLISLKAGTYRFDRTISLQRDGVSVVGAGSDKTIIKVPGDLGREAFEIGTSERSAEHDLAADVSDGGTVLHMKPGHGFEAGDHLMLLRESTGSFFDSIGDDAWRRAEVPLRSSIVEVEGVSGNTVRLESGVHFDFPAGESAVHGLEAVEDVRLGGFTVDYGLGTADPSAFTNELGLYTRDSVITVENAMGLVIDDVVSHDVPSHGLTIRYSAGITVNDVEITGAHNKGEGGNGYAVWIGDVYDSVFAGLSDRDMRHSVLFNSWTSAVGNRVHVEFTDRDVNFHGGRDHDNVVMVDRSIRDANSDVWHPTLYVNTRGEPWGAPTDPEANVVKFGEVVGTRWDDSVVGYDDGARLDGRGGDDRLVGGRGDDRLTGGPGEDVLIGGPGEDVAVYSGDVAQFDISRAEGGLIVRDEAGNQSRDEVSGVEWLLFDDGAVRTSDLERMAKDAVEGGPKADAPGAAEKRPEPAPPPAAEDGLLHAINIGSSSSHTARDGTVFAADTTGVGRRNATDAAIAGTRDDALYQTEAWASGALRYDLAVPDGTYEVTLHFAEIWDGAFRDGRRRFDVEIEGAKVIDDLDLFARVGANRAYETSHVVRVADGRLDVDLREGVQNPKLSAIEVRAADGAPDPAPVEDSRAPAPADDRLKGRFGPDTADRGGMTEFRFDAGALLANDRGAGGTSVEVVAEPGEGELRVDARGRAFAFVFDAETFDGDDAFTYRLVDASGRTSEPATARISIDGLARSGGDGPEMRLIDTRADVALMPLDGPVVLHESVWQGRPLSVAVEATSGVESARFFRGDAHVRTESAAPYTLFGDTDGDHWGDLGFGWGRRERLAVDMHHEDGGEGRVVAELETELTAGGRTIRGRDLVAETFAFDEARMGRVSVEGFEAPDAVAFLGAGPASAVLDRSRVAGEDTRIDFGRGNVLTLEGFTDLDAGNLIV